MALGIKACHTVFVNRDLITQIISADGSVQYTDVCAHTGQLQLLDMVLLRLETGFIQ